MKPCAGSNAGRETAITPLNISSSNAYALERYSAARSVTRLFLEKRHEESLNRIDHLDLLRQKSECAFSTKGTPVSKMQIVFELVSQNAGDTTAVFVIIISCNTAKVWHKGVNGLGAIDVKPRGRSLMDW